VGSVFVEAMLLAFSLVTLTICHEEKG